MKGKPTKQANTKPHNKQKQKIKTKNAQVMQKQSATTSRLMPSQSLSNSSFGKTTHLLLLQNFSLFRSAVLAMSPCSL